MDLEKIESLIRQLLVEIGEDPDREGLVKTPNRVARSWEFLARGYKQNLDTVINDAVFESASHNMVIVKDIEVYSMCEHHLLPFYGKCHIGYISRDRVLGVSKLARIADMFSRRIQIQERLTSQIAKAVLDSVNPEGVGVVMECRHMCMMMRGVSKQNSVMTTSTVLGSFHNDPATRAEFMRLISNKGSV